MTCLIIAEMANAHEGDPAVARVIIEAAAAGGADAIKFQVFTADELAVPDFAQRAVYEQLQFPADTWGDLVAHARGLGLRVYADVFGSAGASLMNSMDVNGFMIHAADILNKPLLRQVGECGRHAILSMAGSTVREVSNALSLLESAGAPSVLLMHGFQSYPTALEHSYLNRIRTLKQEFARPVGFASHIDGGSAEAVTLPMLAAAAGADAVEVHLTLDRAKKGYDYFSSLEPSAFAEMVRRLRAVEPALGGSSMEVTEVELVYRRKHRKWLVATRDMESGEVVREADIAFLRINDPPDTPPPDPDEILGRAVRRRISQFSAIENEALAERR
jgi:N,N'-diacetyllegionaminate synthase